MKILVEERFAQIKVVVLKDVDIEIPNLHNYYSVKTLKMKGRTIRFATRKTGVVKTTLPNTSQFMLQIIFKKFEELYYLLPQ